MPSHREIHNANAPRPHLLASRNTGDCIRDNATTVMRVPAKFGNQATCFMHGQAYLAASSIGQALGSVD